MAKRRKNSKRPSSRSAKAAKARFRAIDAWFAELDRFADVPFMEDGRHQPPIPEAEDLSE
ncbi:MAG TPA: hypothetical protein VGY99_08185 [Candidatus Binataceae bacterium]|jgi:hypothetical protein|nr:hypothetical protein [Candidatus Binataceae bacterium]